MGFRRRPYNTFALPCEYVMTSDEALALCCREAEMTEQ